MDAHLLLVRAGGRPWALRLADVLAVMRPLPVAPLADAPPGVRGIARVRGVAAPVLDLAELLTGMPEPACTRFVAVRTGTRTALLAVGEVAGLIADGLATEPAPPLADAGGRLAAIADRDGDLLAVLATARLLPDAAWPEPGP